MFSLFHIGFEKTAEVENLTFIQTITSSIFSSLFLSFRFLYFLTTSDVWFIKAYISKNNNERERRREWKT